MANVFLYSNKLKTVANIVTTPSSENTIYPKASLVDYNPAKAFRTLNASTSHNIVFDFGVATTIDACGIANPNFTSSATIRIQGHTADSWGAPDVNELFTMSGFSQTPAHRNLFKTFSSASKRYWRLLIDDTTNPDGFYEVGEIYLGQALTLGTGQDFEITWGQNYPDTNIIHQTEYQHDYVYIRNLDRIRTFDVEYRAVTLATMNNLLIMTESLQGSGYPLFFTPVNTSPAESFFVRIAGDFTRQQNSPNSYSLRFTFKELPRGVTLPNT